MKSWRTNLNCIKIFPPPRVDPPLICDVEDLHLHRSIKRRVCHNQLLDLCTRSQQLVVGAENEGGENFFQRPKFNELEKVRITPEWFWKWLLDVILRGKKSRPVEQGAAKGCERDNDCEELEVTRSWAAGWLWNQMWAVRGLRAESALSSYQVFKVQLLLQG